ncbi:hypothetical protein VNO77_12372 [Canavalia gladiata]|uniref:Gnk2-homologous domain-containing protein n=1 Tax=Canavalia gladiata TaxID=3824 RepID=A0AAN9LWN7_CANGL
MLLIIYLFLLSFFHFSITEASDLQYLNHSCSSNKTFTPDSTYQSNLHTLLTSLCSHATTSQFYNTTSGGDAGETIYGSFMCRGDVTNHTCQECLTIATQQIASQCPFSKEAIIWYHQCSVRYSNRYFFSTVDEWPRFTFMNYNATTNSTKEGSYGWLLANTLSDVVGEAANAGPAGTKKFATKNASLSESQNVYTLVQCTPDLSSQDCRKCLGDIMRDIPLCCLGKDCGMVLFPSCSLMFGIDQFYRDVALVVHGKSPPTSLGEEEPDPSGEQKAKSLKIFIAIVPIVVLLMLFLAKRVQRIKLLRRYKAILKEIFGNDSTTLESLHFDLATIEAATDKFSYDNMIGKGGFGEVYKVKFRYRSVNE